MAVRCNKCHSIFTSEYHLDKHINKNIPCDVILACEKCDKVFKSQYNLNSHKKRKTPCKPKVVDEISKLSVKLEITKLKATTALELEREKTNQIKLRKDIKNEEAKNKVIIINNKKDTALEIINAKMEAERFIINAQEKKEKSIIDAEINKAFLKEQEKTKRKEITAVIANKNATQAAIDKVNTIRAEGLAFIEEYIPINEIPFSYKGVVDKFIDLISTEVVDIIKIYQNSENIGELNKRLFNVFLNNKIYPQYRNIFYFVALQEYYVIRRSDVSKVKKPERVDFDTEILPLLHQIVEYVYIRISMVRYSEDHKLIAEESEKFKDVESHVEVIHPGANNNTRKRVNAMKEEYMITLNKDLRDLCDGVTAV